MHTTIVEIDLASKAWLGDAAALTDAPASTDVAAKGPVTKVAGL